MKSLKKMVSIVVVTILLSVCPMAGSMDPVFAAGDPSDEWSATVSATRKTVIEDENFGEGFEFAPFGTLKNGGWERFSGSADDNGSAVNVDNGKVIITPSAGVPSGIRYKFPAQTGCTVFAVRAKRTSEVGSIGSNNLTLNFYFDQEKSYSFTGNNLAMDPALQGEDIATADKDLNRFITGYFMVATGIPDGTNAVIRKFPNGNDWSRRNASKNESADTNLWDSVVIYSTGANYEIESVKIINYSFGVTDPVRFNEDFEGLNDMESQTLSEVLSNKGYTVWNAESGLALGENSDGHYLKLGTDGTKFNKNAAIKFPLPSNVGEEYYLTAKIRLDNSVADEQAADLFMYIDYPDAQGVKHRYALKNNRLDNGAEFTNGEYIAVKDQWTTMMFHLKGTTTELSVKRDGEENFTSLLKDASTEMDSLQFWIQGPVWLDDVRLYEPGGVCVLGLVDDGSNTTVRLRNATEEQLTAKAILVGYDGYQLKDVQINTEDVIANPFEIAEVTIPSLAVNGILERKLFLWKDFNKLVPVTAPFYFYPNFQ